MLELGRCEENYASLSIPVRKITIDLGLSDIVWDDRDLEMSGAATVLAGCRLDLVLVHKQLSWAYIMTPTHVVLYY